MRPRGPWRNNCPRAALLVAVLLGSFVIVAGAFFWNVPVPLALLSPDKQPPTLTLLDARGGALAEIATRDARSRHPLPLDALGTDLPRLTVALEDRRFYAHRGVDGASVFGAAARGLRAGRIVSGASTITEQLIKLTAGRPGGRGWLTKLREAAAAVKLEHRTTKPDILQRYLNALSYGNRLIGPEAAALAYFDKPCRTLSLAECIYLAGLPQAPSRLNPWRHPAAAEYRYGRNVRRLASLGAISAADAGRLADLPPRPGRYLPARRVCHFTALAATRAHSSAGTLRTTLDPALQTVAETLTRRHLADLQREGDTDPQAAVVILDNATGAVQALVGSGDFNDRHQGQVNGAVRPRSAGSTLKPFLYLSAFERRTLTAASILPDTAEAVRGVFADYDPQNYHAGRHLGPVRVRTALGSSLNVPAVVALGRHVGARQAFYEFGRWGFHFPAGLDDYGAGFILGNAEIRLLDLAGAYAGIARGGVAARPRLLLTENAPQEQIASPEACAVITDILCDPEARRATFGAGSPLDFPVGTRVAVKTGTSSAFRDKWCVGFDGRRTVAVWAGHFDGHPMDEAVGIHAAAPLWHALVDYLLREGHDPDVPVPLPGPKLVRREVCSLTGLLPMNGPGAPPTLGEWFLTGTEPQESAETKFVPGSDGDTTNPVLLLPAEYGSWCASSQNLLAAVAENPGSGTLTIVSPPENARYTLDSELPASQQMLELTVNPVQGQEVHWTANGQAIIPHGDGRFFWPLAKGSWSIEARTDNTSAVSSRQVVVE